MSTPTRTQLVAEAEELMRRVGYSAFSYAHLTEKIGIRKASIHYHFPTKQALAEAVVDVAMARFVEALAAIEGGETAAAARLDAYSQLFLLGVEDNLRPLCCALSAELGVLPEAIQEKTRRYFDLHLDWLTRVIDAGRTAGELHWPGEARDLAVLLLTTLEGGSLVARAQLSPGLVRAGFAQVMTQIRTPA
jgi:TetR/AcrR family transcriptional repressor of nem operon